MGVRGSRGMRGGMQGGEGEGGRGVREDDTDFTFHVFPAVDDFQCSIAIPLRNISAAFVSPPLIQSKKKLNYLLGHEWLDLDGLRRAGAGAGT